MGTTSYTESFVLYESTLATYERLYAFDPKVAAEYILWVMRFGIHGEQPPEDSQVWMFGLDAVFASIEAAKSRRATNVDNGQKGGRPKCEIDAVELATKQAEGLTQKELAEHFGVSLSTIQRRLRSEDVKTAVKCQKGGQNCQNLNVNDKLNASFDIKELDEPKMIKGGGSGSISDSLV